ncbi:MAG: leucine-rich repeat domain-containing protein, partial [Bacteroidales bacterium]|nr:leucine-rich repeat domain-containing protein [Bacteroidales bacterium]
NSIGRLALATNDKLTHVTMPQTLRSMGEKAFEWCMGLTSIVIPDSLRIIPKEAFNSCPRLTSVTWGNAVEEIGYAAFWAMSASHLDLPPTLRKLNDLAFAACANNLRTVTIHSQLDTMGEAVFRHANLNRIRFSAAVPPAVTGEGPLYDIGRLDSIVVPCGSLNTWLADSYWSLFADQIVEDCNLGIGDPDANAVNIYTLGGRIIVDGAEGETVRIFDITGRSVRNEALHTGVYIVKVGDRPARKVVIMK